MLDINVTRSGREVPVGLGIFCLAVIEADVVWSEMADTVMTVRSELKDGEHRVTRLSIANPTGLTSSALRRVPLRALAEVVVREVTASTTFRTHPDAAGESTRLRDDQFVGLHLTVPDEGAHPAGYWFGENRWTKAPDKSQGPTAEVLQHVAAIYRAARALGDAPTQAVQIEMDLPRSTATRWLALAREQGHLGADEIGQAGGAPGRLGGQQ